MTPINIITVICDASRMQTIRIACRCGKQWTERIPQELHDSNMIAEFECSACGRIHLLKNHKLVSLTKKEFHDRFPSKEAFGVSRGTSVDPIKYDA